MNNLNSENDTIKNYDRLYKWNDIRIGRKVFVDFEESTKLVEGIIENIPLGIDTAFFIINSFGKKMKVSFIRDTIYVERNNIEFDDLDSQNDIIQSKRLEAMSERK